MNAGFALRTVNAYAHVLLKTTGTPLDSKYVNVEPLYATMTSQCIAIASENAVYVWYAELRMRLTDTDLHGRRRYYKGAANSALRTLACCVANAAAGSKALALCADIGQDEEGGMEYLFHIDDDPAETMQPIMKDADTYV